MRGMRKFLGFMFLCTLCGMLMPTLSEGAPSPTLEREPTPLGQLVDIGGYRLHTLITGKGGPTVVLLTGMGDFSFVWSRVQPQVAKFARVCSYDRAGDAWSDPGPTPRTMKQEVYELHLLLQKAKLKPPYVLVGASYGGLLSRLYAEAYPNEVAGMVLVDSTHENTILSVGNMENGKFVPKLARIRESATGKPVPPVQTMQASPPQPASEKERKEWEELSKLMGPPKIEDPYDRLPPDVQPLQLWFKAHPRLTAPTEDYWAEEMQKMYLDRQKTKYPLGDLPLI
jgi:pimeloyl-ACP methyl ester carboxylesterase